MAPLLWTVAAVLPAVWGTAVNGLRMGASLGTTADTPALRVIGAGHLPFPSFVWLEPDAQYSPRVTLDQLVKRRASVRASLAVDEEQAKWARLATPWTAR